MAKKRSWCLCRTQAKRRAFQAKAKGVRPQGKGKQQVTPLRATRQGCFLAGHHLNHLQVPEMDHTQPRDGHGNEPVPLGQMLFEHSGSDAPLRLGPPGFGSMASRSNDVPSSSHATQFPGHRVVNLGTSHVSLVPYRTARSSGHVPYDAQPKPALSSHVDNRMVAMKRKNLLPSVEGMDAVDYYVGSSSNSHFSDFVQPNPSALTEPLHPQVPLSVGPSNWIDQRLVNQEGSQRNVRARHDSANVSLEPRPASTYTPSNNHQLPFHSATSAFVSTAAERNQAPFSVPTRTLPSGGTGITGRIYHHPMPMHSSSSSVAAAPTVHGSSNSAMFANAGFPAPRAVHGSGAAAAPTVHGSSDSAVFANGGFTAPRAVHGGAVPSYGHPSSTVSSGSRAFSHDAVIPNYPASTSTSIRINLPSPISTAASSRHARVSMAHASTGRNRFVDRSSFHLIAETQRVMMEQLAFYQQSRQAAADPHRDLRLNIDEMSYEELLALEESIGTVNTGLADEKISGCVKEVVCCSSDEEQDDEDDGRCLVCLACPESFAPPILIMIFELWQEEYKDNDLLGILKCRHDFHTDCIKKWLQVKNACPVCKSAAA
ncbi:E3 ubiquitin ligase BIG BROTHER-related protein [Triticum urartu]|uniref:RING-type E3 ubiquitin transferase n=1 Tax=Triticum urartu TaxID=4572 RepID=M8A737_TRIUA|nr:E3 ubiquitin ligase BIG BROTHER-related protein [Triticum urartu]